MKRIKQRIKALMKQIKQVSKAFKEWFTTNLLSILIVLLFVLAVIFLSVILCPDLAWDKWLYRSKGEVLDFIGIAMGGVLLAIQATVSYRRVKTMEDTAKAQADAAQAQADAAKAQAKANQNTEQGQRQERLKNAIEHLGHERPSVRLGGTYELFHLAEDIEELRQTVLEILCAHIRQTTRSEAYQEEYGKKPSEEIQSLLNLLFVQDHKVFDGCHINLQESRLNGASLSQARLQKADLVGAQLQEAYLSGAQLQEAVLWEAQLQGAKLFSAQLQGADLSEAQLQGARLSGAQLQGAMLLEAQLQGADLQKAQLQGADLSGVQLQGAVLWDAQLQEAELNHAQLQGIISSDDNKRQQTDTLPDFAERIRRRIDQKSDFSNVVFSGGLSEDEVNNMTKEMLDSEFAAWLKKSLKPHIDQPASHELPAGSGARTGTYTRKDADRWIKEYQEAIGRDDVHS